MVYSNYRERNLLLGVLGTILFMIGDWLLDVKGAGNITYGFVESNWVSMSMWRFEASILLGAAAVPFYWPAAKEMVQIMRQGSSPNSRVDRIMSRIFSVGALAAAFSWVFIHIMCCLLPIIFKCAVAAGMGFDQAAALVNQIGLYILVPFVVYFIVSDGCLSAGWIFMTLRGRLPVSKWAFFCCPVFTVLLAGIVNLIPVVNQITGAFESMGHLLMISALLIACGGIKRTEVSHEPAV